MASGLVTSVLTNQTKTFWVLLHNHLGVLGYVRSGSTRTWTAHSEKRSRPPQRYPENDDDSASYS